MAILNGINTKLRGSVGQYTFSRHKGQTIVKEKVERKETPVRTDAQMLTRMRLANIIHIWQSFKGDDKPSFETKEPTQADYNLFVKANMAVQGVFLPKGIVEQSGAVVAPYQVTRGSLPTIGGAFIEGRFVSTLSLGGTTIGASSTLKTFSEALTADRANGCANGDQLSIFILRQTVEGGIPRVETNTYEITLNTSDDATLLGDLVDANLLAVVEGKLALGSEVTGGVAFILSRQTAGGTLVSTQRIVVNNATLAEYQTRAAYEAATLSYGGVNKQSFLTPNNSTDYVFVE